MRRREFITLVGAVVLPQIARAQSSSKIPRLGFLGVTEAANWASRLEAPKSGSALECGAGRRGRTWICGPPCPECDIFTVRRRSWGIDHGTAQKTFAKGHYPQDAATREHSHSYVEACDIWYLLGHCRRHHASDHTSPSRDSRKDPDGDELRQRPVGQKTFREP